VIAFARKVLSFAATDVLQGSDVGQSDHICLHKRAASFTPNRNCGVADPGELSLGSGPGNGPAQRCGPQFFSRSGRGRSRRSY
jgi:hypothetical protein